MMMMMMMMVLTINVEPDIDTCGIEGSGCSLDDGAAADYASFVVDDDDVAIANRSTTPAGPGEDGQVGRLG